MADQFEISLRKKQAGQSFMLARLDHEQICTCISHLAQDRIRDRDTRLYARINDNPLTPHPIRHALEATAIFCRLEARKPFRLGVDKPLRDRGWYRIE
jgi:hypothetical protein